MWRNLQIQRPPCGLAGKNDRIGGGQKFVEKIGRRGAWFDCDTTERFISLWKPIMIEPHSKCWHGFEIEAEAQ